VLDSNINSGQAELMTDEVGELHQLRESLRGHCLVLAKHGKDPLEGTWWGQDFDRYVVLLDTLARQFGILEVPIFPWTFKTVVAVDERCRAVGLLDGPPFLSKPA
jgi:hypothetical protein